MNRDLGRRYYDLNRGAIVISYGVIGILSFIFGFIAAKLF